MPMYENARRRSSLSEPSLSVDDGGSGGHAKGDGRVASASGTIRRRGQPAVWSSGRVLFRRFGHDGPHDEVHQSDVGREGHEQE